MNIVSLFLHEVPTFPIFLMAFHHQCVIFLELSSSKLLLMQIDEVKKFSVACLLGRHLLATRSEQTQTKTLAIASTSLLGQY